MSILHENREARRTVLTGGAAALVHIVLFVLSTRSPASAKRALSEPLEDTVEVALVPVPAPTSTESPSEAPSEAPSEENAGAAVDGRPSQGAPARTEVGAAAVATNKPPATAAPSDAEVVTAPPNATAAPVMLFAPTTGALGLAGSGPNPFAGAGGPGGAGSAERPVQGGFHSAAPDAPTAAEAKRAVERSLKDAIRAQDVSVGLGPEGPVLSALQEGTYGSLAPDHGSAIFVATVNESGTVTDLRLLSSGGGDGWSDALERATHLLKGKKLNLRGGGAAELRIAVQYLLKLGCQLV